MLKKHALIISCGLLLQLVAFWANAEVVVVVSPKSPITEISRLELADVYLGRLTRLGNGQPVVPIDQAQRTDAHEEFYAEYLGRSAAAIKAHWARLIFTGRGQPPKSVQNDHAVIDRLVQNPNAIGYLNRQAVDDRVRVLNVE